MGHETILVIDDNFLEQLGKFQRTEYADPLSKHILSVEILDKAKAYYEKGSKTEDSFLSWVKRMYAVDILVDGSEPDLTGAQKNGWIVLDANGEISSVIERMIPEGFFDWFEGTLSYWKLKPDAEGINVNFAEEFSVATEYAGSAKKSAIDLASMWEIIERCAAERWDHAMAACGSQTWEAFDVVWDKYKSEKYSHELQRLARTEWAEQPAVKAILAMPEPDESLWKELSQQEFNMRNHLWQRPVNYGIDKLHLPRNTYINSYSLRSLLSYSIIIKDGILLIEPDERALFDSLADDTLLTIAYVHS
ncbi:hypothetical protein [Undibacterium pigrum]|uniref:Uncharacterized protein n=1 Tax=Undibacterium pigrum TaxID=401470 RepID=A0A318J429_9BURK|nr:hypothetical protein [Undibacterium pigrum]PXX41441.1 hypothetical protein DFR42_10792 [Undibacterium pigrum]